MCDSLHLSLCQHRALRYVSKNVKLPFLSAQRHKGVNSLVMSSMLQCFGLHFLQASDKGQVEIKLH